MRIAVLGCGSIGRRHLSNLQHLGYRELLAFDIAQGSRQFVQDNLNVQTTDQVRNIWHFSPDAVLICTPPSQHIEYALTAARNGCHLFIEKPLADRLDGLASLIEIAGRNNLTTMVACNMRFHPGPKAIRQHISAGAIGKVMAARLQFSSYLPTWRPWQDYRSSYTASVRSGGAILDCIHEIDLAFWYFGHGQVVASACMSAESLALETDGLAEIIIRHDSECLTNVHVSFIQRDYRRTCQIIGSAGTLYWDFECDEVKIYGADGKLAESFSGPGDWQLNQMYIDEMRHFMEKVESRSQTVNPISGGLVAVEAALEARRQCGLPASLADEPLKCEQGLC